jgi:cutinase
MKGISSLLAIISTAAVSRVLAIPVASLEERQSTGDTRNDLANGSPCKAVTVIFARGTTESGNVGSLVGPPFFTALSGDIGAVNLAVQGVAYPADIAGFLAGGDATGSATMAQLVNQAMTQCPQTKVVLSGYR